MQRPDIETKGLRKETRQIVREEIRRAS